MMTPGGEQNHQIQVLGGPRGPITVQRWTDPMTSLVWVLHKSPLSERTRWLSPAAPRHCLAKNGISDFFFFFFPACRTREPCCYLLIPELPLEHRSGSVSRRAPCAGTARPADRKARLASHKEANTEEHFLSRRGFVRRTRSSPPS